jgi:hypothetical protein
MNELEMQGAQNGGQNEGHVGQEGEIFKTETIANML